MGYFSSFSEFHSDSRLMEAGFGAQLGPPYTLRLSRGSHKWWITLRSKQVSQSLKSQAMSNIDLHQSPSQDFSEAAHSVTSFRQLQTMIQLAPQVADTKGGLTRYQILLRQILLWVVSTCTRAYTLWLRSFFPVS